MLEIEEVQYNEFFGFAFIGDQNNFGGAGGNHQDIGEVGSYGEGKDVQGFDARGDGEGGGKLRNNFTVRKCVQGVYLQKIGVGSDQILVFGVGEVGEAAMLDSGGWVKRFVAQENSSHVDEGPAVAAISACIGKNG